VFDAVTQVKAAKFLPGPANRLAVVSAVPFDQLE